MYKSVEFTYGDQLYHPSAVTSISDGANYTYDANGNVLTGAGRSYAWTVDNRLDVVGSAVMSYDYTGIRVKKSGFGTTYFPFTGYEVQGTTVTKYIRIGNEIIASKEGTSTKRFYHNDHLGGVNVITDSYASRVQLTEYDPWGKVSRSEGSVDPTHRFTGQELDPESDIHYYGGRYRMGVRVRMGVYHRNLAGSEGRRKGVYHRNLAGSGTVGNLV